MWLVCGWYVVVCGGMWWYVVGMWWYVMVCGGMWWYVLNSVTQSIVQMSFFL